MNQTSLKPESQNTVSEFRNEPLTDFGVEAHAQKIREAIKTQRQHFGQHYDLWIGGQVESSQERITSVNPSCIDEVVGTVACASADQATRALESAQQHFQTWRSTSAQERAQLLFNAAKLLREQKYDFSALMVLEVGKSWVEADADVAEAIDFLEFYARQALKLDQPPALTPVSGEDNQLFYIPLGVGVVIPPWNFPLAILAGMTVASLVTGNTVVLKPSSDAPIVAAKFVELMKQSGCPPGILNFCPGRGSEIGDLLIDHPLTRFVSFTGSKEVGLRIVERAGRTQPGQIWIKRVVAEMGGKDAILVDSECDFQSAVQGTLASAFGFSGQKCSACSRVIVHQSIYDSFVDELIKQGKNWVVGNLKNNESHLGPVSSRQAYESIRNYIETGKKESRLVLGGGFGDDKGWFIQPTIFADVSPEAVIAREEIFGPVLAVIKCEDFDQGLKIVNSTEYGLTGAVYSTNKENLEKAKQDFHVGNLYFNRKCTGALVGAHPFGGFNMSGTDSKAGGYDYLLLFTQAKLLSSKI